MRQFHFPKSEQIVPDDGETVIILTNKLDNPRTLSPDDGIEEAYLSSQSN